MAAPGSPVSPKHFYDYVSDSGLTYKILMSDYIATQNDTAANSIIGAVLTGSNKRTRFPAKGYKPRRATLRATTIGVDRQVIVLTPNAPLITVPTPAGAGSLTLNHGVNNTEVFTYEGEFETEVGPGRRL